VTAPIQDPTTDRALQGLAYQRDQVVRRPKPIVSPQWAIKLFSDDPTSGVTVVGDDRWRFTIPHTMDGWYLSYVELGLGTTDSGSTEAQLRNVDNGDVDMLSTVVTIDAGDWSSEQGGGFVIDQANALVAKTNRIAIDIDSGSDGTGLHIYIWFAVRPTTV
jgi:hypothetical protein